MPITESDIEKIAQLAHLEITPEERRAFTPQIAEIVAYVEQLNELDTDGVEPMAHAVELSNVFRADELQPSLPREAALANAPHHDDECYLVPAVLGE